MQACVCACTDFFLYLLRVSQLVTQLATLLGTVSSLGVWGSTLLSTGLRVLPLLLRAKGACWHSAQGLFFIWANSLGDLIWF